METAKGDAVKEFRALQAFIDSYAEYYSDGFEDCLKQVKSLYLHLDFSKVSMDDPVPSTPAGDATLDENDGLLSPRRTRKMMVLFLLNLLLWINPSFF